MFGGVVAGGLPQEHGGRLQRQAPQARDCLCIDAVEVRVPVQREAVGPEVRQGLDEPRRGEVATRIHPERQIIRIEWGTLRSQYLQQFAREAWR